MDFFKKPIVALILALVVVCGSTILNTQIKLGEEVQEVEDSFFTSVSGEKSIYIRLDECLSAANGLWTVLVNYDSDAADELSEVRKDMIWDYDLQHINGLLYGNNELSEVFKNSLSVLNGYDLTDSELAAVADYSDSFYGAQKMIEKNSYNSLVQDFLRSTYNKFPASIFASIAGVDAPEIFY